MVRWTSISLIGMIPLSEWSDHYYHESASVRSRQRLVQLGRYIGMIAVNVAE